MVEDRRSLLYACCGLSLLPAVQPESVDQGVLLVCLKKDKVGALREILGFAGSAGAGTEMRGSCKGQLGKVIGSRRQVCRA